MNGFEITKYDGRSRKITYTLAGSTYEIDLLDVILNKLDKVCGIKISGQSLCVDIPVKNKIYKANIYAYDKPTKKQDIAYLVDDNNWKYDWSFRFVKDTGIPMQFYDARCATMMGADLMRTLFGINIYILTKKDKIPLKDMILNELSRPIPEGVSKLIEYRNKLSRRDVYLNDIIDTIDW